VLAFAGVPQIVLIAAAVTAFGPWWGGAYSWIATLTSSLVGFWLGRAIGAQGSRRWSSEGLERITQAIGRNGFWASLAVRLFPFAPFVVVNMAAGVTPMRFADFIAGTAIGIVPKIAFTALTGGAAIRLINDGDGWSALVLLTIAALAWFGLALAARRWLKR
nr:TVP38/TMEM64 family protein [Caulobacteraceae bacterium]